MPGRQEQAVTPGGLTKCLGFSASVAPSHIRVSPGTGPVRPVLGSIPPRQRAESGGFRRMDVGGDIMSSLISNLQLQNQNRATDVRFRIADCAAASRATGTRKGEQDT